MSGKWIELSEGLYYFGNGGITRVEEVQQVEDYYKKKSEYITTLFSGTEKITVVKNSVDSIKNMLYNGNRDE